MQRDLGQRELPHVDLGGPVLQADVQHHAAGLDRGERRLARGRSRPPRRSRGRSCLPSGRRSASGSKAAHRRAARRAASRRSALVSARWIAPRAPGAQQQRREQPMAPAADHQHGALRHGAGQRARGEGERVQRRGGRLGERGGAHVHALGQVDHGARRGDHALGEAAGALSCRSWCGWRTGCRGPARSTRSARRR